METLEHLWTLAISIRWYWVVLAIVIIFLGAGALFLHDASDKDGGWKQ